MGNEVTFLSAHKEILNSLPKTNRVKMFVSVAQSGITSACNGGREASVAS